MKTSVLVLLVLLLTSLSAGASPLDDEAVYQARFQQLFASFRAGLGLETYEPLESVPGAREHRPLPKASRASIDSTALQQARDYAAANRSSAFLVWRDGVIEEASYFGDTKEESLLTSRSLAKPSGRPNTGSFGTPNSIDTSALSAIQSVLSQAVAWSRHTQRISSAVFR